MSSSLGLLDHAQTKTSDKASTLLVLDTNTEVTDIAQQVCDLKLQIDSLDEQYGVQTAELKSRVELIQQEVEKDGGASKTVSIPVKDEHNVQVTFKGYNSIPARTKPTTRTPEVNNEKLLVDQLGRKVFNALVVKKRTISVPSHVSNDKKKLETMLDTLVAGLGEEAAQAFIAEYLEVKEELTPVATYAKDCWKYPIAIRRAVSGFFQRTIAVSVK